MGLFAKLRGELIDIIEWIDDSRHTLVWRFPRYQNEIKNGAQLIVRPGQVAVFVTQGRIADVFEPGHFELTTRNLPILSTLAGWKHGFDSPFKSEVYFVSTRQVTDLKWGTPNPIMLRDPDFGPIRLRAFGTYSLKAADPKVLLKELVGTDGVFATDELETLLRSTIGTAFAERLASSQIAALDLARSYQQLSDQLKKDVVAKIDDEYGLDVPQLAIVNISFPEEVEKALDARASMGVIGDLQRFQQYQVGKSLPEMAAAGGAAGDGMGLGMGFALAQQMARGMAPGAAAPAASAPPPPPPAAWHVADAGVTHGPWSAAQLEEAIAAGRVRGDTLVWSAGMAGWAAAATLPSLAARFAARPPPPPPAR
ncbi:MAG: SPFH domain-containing protein [Planctomycetes bacterium]|nr:SPFH domain-containing protein [Planctomycetota bacterium]